MGRRKQESHVNHERWMVSFADFMTLLFALFVVLFAISDVDEAKLEQVADSVDQAFGIMDSRGPSIIDANPERSAPIKPILTPESPLPPDSRGQQDQLVEKLQKALSNTDKLAASVQLRQESRGIIIQLKDTRLFTSGSAVLQNEIRSELKKIISELQNPGNQIRIEGHTDNVPIHSGTYTSNWELSAARANSVLQFFLSQTNLKPEQFSVAGYGEYRPIAPNNSAENRARNRRVDIVILNERASLDEPASNTNSNQRLDQQLNQKLKQGRN